MAECSRYATNDNGMTQSSLYGMRMFSQEENKQDHRPEETHNYVDWAEYDRCEEPNPP